MSRIFLLLLVLGAAVGVPYVSTEWSKIKAKLTGGSDPASLGSSIASSGQKHTPIVIEGQSAAGFPPPGSDETPVVDIAQVFKFDVTPQAVMARWPRVSSGLVEEQLYGMRVPLITGTRYDDLAGALTYYFTPSQRCAKITFSGTTGDPKRMVSMLVDRFGFQRYTSTEPGASNYQIRWNGKAHSDLMIRPAAVVRSSAPNSRYSIQLTIVQPGVK